MDAAAPPRRRDAADLADRRRHQLRDARARPAAARLRRGAALGPDRGAAGGGGGDPHHPRRRRAPPRSRRPAHHRRLRPDRARGGDGRGVDGDPARQRADRRRHRGGPLRPGDDRPRRAAPQAAQRGVTPVRARGGPAAAAGRGRAGRAPPGRVRRRHDRGRSHGRWRRADARARADGAGSARPRGGRGLPAGRHGSPPRPGGMRGRARGGRRRARPGRRDAAVVAAGPRAVRRPRRGGAAAGGLRGDPLGAADRARRPGPHRRAATAAGGVGGAGRGGLRRGAAVPVHRPGNVGRLRAGRGRPPPPYGARPEPARRRPRRAHHHAAAGLARYARPQPVPRGGGSRALHGRARSSCRTASSSSYPSLASTDVLQTPRSRRSPRRCPLSRCTSAWCSPGIGSHGAGGARDGRQAGPTPWRPPGSSARPRGSSCGSPRATTRRGTPAGAPCCGSATSRSASRASCTRR